MKKLIGIILFILFFAANAAAVYEESCSSSDPLKIEPFAGTTWQFTYAVDGRTYTDTIVFTSQTVTSDGKEILKCQDQDGLNGGLMYTGLPSELGGGCGFAVLISDTVSDQYHYYFFKLTDNKAAGYWLSETDSEQSDPYLMTGVKTEDNASCSSSDPEKIKPLAGTTWEFNYSLDGNSITDTISFDSEITASDSGKILLVSEDKKGAKGAVFYTEFPAELGGGCGFAASILSDDLNQYYFFKADDDSASGYWLWEADEDISDPYAMTGVRKVSGSDKYLAADFGENGLYLYDGDSWEGITGWNPEHVIKYGDMLAADFGDEGLYLYDGASWKGITGWNPENIVKWGDMLAADFGENGLYLYDGDSWKGVTGWNPENMTAYGDKLAADFGANGLYLCDGDSWQGIAGWNPESIVAWEDVLAADFGANGLYLYDGDSWEGITGWNPENIIAWEEGLIFADFGANGLYSYNGVAWKGLADWNPENIVTLEDMIAADFGANGLYLYDGSSWKGVTGWNPENIVVYGDILTADFGDKGLYLYDGSAWTGIVGWNPEEIVNLR